MLGNVPHERSPLIGRKQSLSQVQEALTRARVATIVGGPGMGKTRLALAAGQIFQEGGRFPGGVWFCRLSRARGADEAFRCIGNALGVEESPDAIEQELARLGPAILIVDSAELHEAYLPAQLAQWLDHAPTLRVLATSQAALQIKGEVLITLAALDGDEAQTLFQQRAKNAGGDVSDQASVEKILELLRGNPLAIELAAARTSVLSPSDLLRRIPKSMDVLKSRQVDVSARHGSFRAALAWSWATLSPEQKQALARATVFVGSFDIDAAEAILGGGPDLIDELQALSSRAWIEVSSDGGEMRFTVPASARRFVAGADDVDREDVGNATSAHRQHYLERAREHTGDTNALAPFRSELEKIFDDATEMPAAAAALSALAPILLAEHAFDVLEVRANRANTLPGGSSADATTIGGLLAQSVAARKDYQKEIAALQEKQDEWQPEALVVAHDLAWYRAPQSDRVQLSRRRVLKKIFEALVEARNLHPGRGISVPEIIEAAWPGEKLSPDSASSRVYVAIGELRKLGLKGILERSDDDGGYRLRPDVALAITPKT